MEIRPYFQIDSGKRSVYKCVEQNQSFDVRLDQFGEPGSVDLQVGAGLLGIFDALKICHRECVIDGCTVGDFREELKTRGFKI